MEICTVCNAAAFTSGWRCGSVVRASVFGWQTFPDLGPIYGWRVTTMWVNSPLWVRQLGQLSIPSLGVRKRVVIHVITWPEIIILQTRNARLQGPESMCVGESCLSVTHSSATAAVELAHGAIRVLSFYIYRYNAAYWRSNFLRLWMSVVRDYGKSGTRGYSGHMVLPIQQYYGTEPVRELSNPPKAGCSPPKLFLTPPNTVFHSRC